ncbi:hypothetical protein [Bradyrhizobium cosmicum]|uniref:hypothetical protein n=1 Tax=Bradyrhizobium cosmicum TaxID=1404864 RepID=UPI0028EC5FE5|nr:hypothetical protein [Bradyrhizobium cosmicum]
MAKRGGLIGFAVLATALGAWSVVAATSSRIDLLFDGPSLEDTIDVGTTRPIAEPTSKPLRHGNPLWATPLSALTATEERPIFSASRRPPPQGLTAAPVKEVVASPSPKAPDAPPPLVLVGAVVGEDDAIAVLLDKTDQKVIRLRRGESRGGWLLSAVQPRQVTFKQGDRNEVFSLRREGGSTSQPVQ